MSRPLPTVKPHRSGLSSVPEAPSQATVFRLGRVIVFTRLIFWLSLIFFVGEYLSAYAFRDLPLGQLLGAPPHRTHGAATLAALAGWRLARRWRHSASQRMALVLDAASLWAICALLAGMALELSWLANVRGAIVPERLRFLLISVLAVGVTISARAIIVPTRPHQAIWLNVVACVPLLSITLEVTSAFSFAERMASIVDVVLWSGSFVALATVASKVMHGLRERVREARQLGQYTLDSKIGEGGMGEVYRARHALLRRPTAVKLIRAEAVAERELRRFEREVQLTASLSHPNTISVYDYGRTPDGIFYYAMELLEGLNLEELVKDDGRQPPGRVIHIVRQACGALAEAHSVGLVHRDVKPSNIFLAERGGVPDMVKVLDFGLVKNLREVAPDGGSLTGSETITGTPLYMAPEAIAGGSEVGPRSDLYALGAVAYYLLTGRPVFTDSSLIAICASHLHRAPEPPSRYADVPEDLEALVLQCLAKEPAERPASARVLATSLDGCRSAKDWSEAEAQAWWHARRPTQAPDVAPAGRPLDIGFRDRAAE
jgi:serine/threonine-protein kinase